MPGRTAVATSRLIAPPVLATAVRVLHDAAPDRGFLDEVVPKLDASHRWFHRERTHAESGLMVIHHGWESADNAPRFDRALARIDISGVKPIERTDTLQVAADERPTELDYLRYLALVQWLRERGYRPRPPSSAPFAYLDLPLNSILAVAEDDLASLQDAVGADGERARTAAARLRTALGAMWDERAGAYRERDLHGEERVTETVADLFPLYAVVPDERQARRLADDQLLSPERYGPVASCAVGCHDRLEGEPRLRPAELLARAGLDQRQLVFVRGLERYGLRAEADELRRLTLDLVAASGFWEGTTSRRPAPGSGRGNSRGARRSRSTSCVTYDPEPRYAVSGGEVEPGWEPLVAEVVCRGADRRARRACRARLGACRRTALSPARRRGARRPPLASALGRSDGAPPRPSEIAGDPVFARLAGGSLRDLFDELPRPQRDRLTLVYGPGAGLVPHDLLCYADVPKRTALASVRRGAAGNVGQPAGMTGSEQRLLFFDWPLQDRQQRELLPSLDRFVDASEPDAHDRSPATRFAPRCTAWPGDPSGRVRASLPGPWGGTWLRDRIGIDTEAPNLAWSARADHARERILFGDPRPSKSASSS